MNFTLFSQCCCLSYRSIKKVRETILRIHSNIIFIYIKRTLPEKVGHFYEEPTEYKILDHDILSVEESFQVLQETILREDYVR